MNLCADYWEGEDGYSRTWVEVKALPVDSPFRPRNMGPRPPEELYDVRADPYQMNNLAQDPAHTDVKKALARSLVAEQLATDDPRTLGNYEDVIYGEGSGG